MTALRNAWSRLGFAFTEPPADAAVDPEDVLAATIQHAREDSRLFWGAATWLHRYGALVDGRRLAARLGSADPSGDEPAVLAALVIASKSPHLKGLLHRCNPLQSPEPLFRVRLRNAAGLGDLKQRALAPYLRWGLLLADEVLKLDALRPTSWVLRHNPALLVRAILGADLRAEIVCALIGGHQSMSASDLTRRLGRSYAAVHASCSSLEAGGFLRKEGAGRSLRLAIPEDVKEWIQSYPSSLPPRARDRPAA